MKLNNFNYSFFIVIICVSLALLYSGWSYKEAKEIVSDNQKYENISCEQERQFNEWDLHRSMLFSYIFGGLLFIVLLIYLFLCIEMGDKKCVQ